MDILLYDVTGYAVAYMQNNGNHSIFTWDGYAACYLINNAVYGWNGRHLGWFINGVMYDLNGKRVGFVEQTCPHSLRRPATVPHLGALPSYAPIGNLHPMSALSCNNSTILLKDFLLQGRK